MTQSLDPDLDAGADWPLNYFNYFTEIEEHFQRVRGTALFLLSPLDWALIESWKNAGVPVEAVLQGIDDAFENWRHRKNRRQTVNSIAYCTQAVMKAAERSPTRSAERSSGQAPFSEADLVRFLETSVAALRQKPESAFNEIADSVESLARDAPQQLANLQSLELRLTALEEKMKPVRDPGDLCVIRALA